MTEERKLAAIVFTDIVGYSAMTQRNEALALQLLEEHKSILRPLFTEFGGKEIKTIGDAFLVEFSSALSATQCAIRIQRSLYERNKAVEPSRILKLRIGVHVGDVVARENDVFGDGVNIASRIEPMASPGGICISEDVARQVRNKIEFGLNGIGRGDLKNISQTINLFLVDLPWERQTFVRQATTAASRTLKRYRWLAPTAVGLALVVVFLIQRSSSSSSFAKTRIAVMPFLNFSGDQQDEYFAEGMTEELISSLSRIAGFNVIARTSVLKYKGLAKDVSQIGSELMVGTILEGSVRKGVDSARISVKLIDAATQNYVWSDDYNRSLKDLLMIQSEIAQKVAGELQVQLLTHEKASLERAGTMNEEAHRLFLSGRYAMNKRTPADVLKALELFSQAVQLDKQYAVAYSSLAECYTLLAVGYGSAPQSEVVPKARAAADRAVALDGTLGEAHAALAYVLFRLEWDFEQAEREFKRAIELQPSYARVHETYALFLSINGRADESISEMMRAMELDPQSASVKTGLGRIYQFAKRYDIAERQLRKTVAEYPDYPEGHFALGMQLGVTRRYSEAVKENELAVSLSGRRPVILASLATVYWGAGRHADARKVVDEVVMQSKTQNILPSILSQCYLSIGDTAKSLEYFARAYEERDPFMVFYKVEGFNQDDAVDPRFTAIVDKIGKKGNSR